MSGDATRRDSSASDQDQGQAPASSPTSAGVDVFDDRFATDDRSSSRRVPSIRTENPFQSTSDSDSTSSAQSQRPLPGRSLAEDEIAAHRNSMAKDAQDDDEDEFYSPEAESSSATAGVAAHRSMSSASTSSYAPPLSPASITNGPSHPYGMYPQNLSVSRSASTATSSTVRAPQSRQGPSHPYGLYPQDVSGDMPSQNSIPLGFPGHGQDFHRRIGMDGEEQGIIGAYGHTEQLPPYSRYPEEHHTKIAGSATLPAIGEQSSGEGASENVEMQERSPAQALPNTDASQTTAQPETSTPVNPTSSNGSSNQNSQSEKSWREKSWSEKKHTKFFGWLPFWAVIFVALVILISAIVCGAAIGAVFKSQEDMADKFHHLENNMTSQHPATITKTKYIDATPIPEPINHPEYPDGNWAAQFMGQGLSECIIGRDDKKAWTCQLPQDGNVAIDVGSGPQGGVDGAWISTGPIDGEIFYGSQPPSIDNEPLRWVEDVDQPHLGYACGFQTTYDKLVVVPENYLHDYGNKAKRDHYQPGGPITVGEQVWFCYWNSTYIEGFIYMEPQMTSYPTSTPTYPHPSNIPSTYSMLSSLIYPYRSAYSVSGSSFSPYPSKPPNHPNDSPTTASPTPTSLSPFPRLLKLEERRLAGQGQDAYCQLMRKVEGSGFSRVTAPQGRYPTINLQEKDPLSASVSVEVDKRATPTQPVNARRFPQKVPPSGCYCEWIYDPA